MASKAERGYCSGGSCRSGCSRALFWADMPSAARLHKSARKFYKLPCLCAPARPPVHSPTCPPARLPACMQANGYHPSSVTIAGGATRSPLWLQIHADVSNTPFVLTK